MRFALSIGMLLLLACEPSGEAVPRAPSIEPVVATVSNQPVEIHEVASIAEQRGLARDQALEAAIREKLAVAEARGRGLEQRDPKLGAAIESIRRSAREREERLLRSALFAAVRADVTITEAELREQYEKTKASYFTRQLRLRVATRDTREAAEQLDAELGPTGRLDPAASEEVGPAPVERLPKPLLPEALALKTPGDRAVVEAPGSWWLVELVEVLPAVPRPFGEVREQVDGSLRTLRAQEAYDRLIEELRAKAEVKIDQAVLADERLWKAEQPADREGKAKVGR